MLHKLCLQWIAMLAAALQELAGLDGPTQTNTHETDRAYSTLPAPHNTVK